MQTRVWECFQGWMGTRLEDKLVKPNPTFVATFQTYIIYTTSWEFEWKSNFCLLNKCLSFLPRQCLAISHISKNTWRHRVNAHQHADQILEVYQQWQNTLGQCVCTALPSSWCLWTEKRVETSRTTAPICSNNGRPQSAAIKKNTQHILVKYNTLVTMSWFTWDIIITW